MALKSAFALTKRLCVAFSIGMVHVDRYIEMDGNTLAAAGAYKVVDGVLYAAPNQTVHIVDEGDGSGQVLSLVLEPRGAAPVVPVAEPYAGPSSPRGPSPSARDPQLYASTLGLSPHDKRLSAGGRRLTAGTSQQPCRRGTSYARSRLRLDHASLQHQPIVLPYDARMDPTLFPGNTDQQNRRRRYPLASEITPPTLSSRVYADAMDLYPEGLRPRKQRQPEYEPQFA